MPETTNNSNPEIHPGKIIRVVTNSFYVDRYYDLQDATRRSNIPSNLSIDKCFIIIANVPNNKNNITAYDYDVDSKGKELYRNFLKRKYCVLIMDLVAGDLHYTSETDILVHCQFIMP